MAFYDETFNIDYSLLKACSLVCREWSAAAQKLLFHNVTLRTQSACLSFQNAVDPITEQGRMLGEAVVRMRVILDHNQPFGITEQSFAQAFVLCPNLFELNLALYGSVSPGRDIIGSPDSLRMRRPAPSFDESTPVPSPMRALPSPPSSSPTGPKNSHSVSQLLSVWPSLKSLVLSGNAPELPSDELPPFPCAPPRVSHEFPSLPFTRLHGLATASFHRQSPRARYGPRTVHAAPRLFRRHVRKHSGIGFASCLLARHGTFLASLPAFTADQCGTTTRISSSLQKCLERLEHIAFGLNKMTALQSVIEAVKTQKSLKAVTVHHLGW